MKSISRKTHYYNIRQFRLDAWNDLKEDARELSPLDGEKTPTAKTQERIVSHLKKLATIERYWAYPGVDHLNMLNRMYQRKEFATFFHTVANTVASLSSESYRSDPSLHHGGRKNEHYDRGQNHYFEVLLVDNMSNEDASVMEQELRNIRGKDDRFFYKMVIVRSFKEALQALSFNVNIQACVVRYDIPYKTHETPAVLEPFVSSMFRSEYKSRTSHEWGSFLGSLVRRFRPEIDLYYVTDSGVESLNDSSLKNFNRIFYRKEDLQELHLSIMGGIKERFETPFFSALVDYSQKPTGVFHAMPISRGNSIFKSRWIRDFADFYGRNLLLAETSATSGGLDSLLQPVGPLKKAQSMAANAFGAQQTFFVTNGTSTANKIVLQALLEPGDIVLVDRDCHKSHHYGMVLSGATAVYLDSYPIKEYSMYGAVPLTEIRDTLLELREAGRLDLVKMLLLTNCTFDGIVYNVEKVMQEILAIKPDIIFLWDEAWFAFAGFTYTYKQRTAMYVAEKLYRRYNSEEYRKTYKKAVANGTADRLPDPDLVKVRAYATQSTHKTLSSLRQGSMIHIHDQDFRRRVEDSFHEAYMTHTSTSPNYQILASLDIGRRQVQFEGYELSEKSVELAMVLRSQINDDPLLAKYFHPLTVKDFIPEEFRESGLEEYYETETGWNHMEEAWNNDEFVLDPTKLNLSVGLTGINGNTFKNKYLMDQFGIQINKTSRNTVLFMTNIGTTQGSVAYLIKVLREIALQIEEEGKALNEAETAIQKKKVWSLTEGTPSLPNFSRFHHSFQAVPGIRGGNLREAFFLSYRDNRCDFMSISECAEAVEEGREIVSASFVIPYPPGFPILVPGQIMSPEILEFLQALDVTEIHGYRPELGLRIFNDSALNRQQSSSAMMGAPSEKNNSTTPNGEANSKIKSSLKKSTAK